MAFSSRTDVVNKLLSRVTSLIEIEKQKREADFQEIQKRHEEKAWNHLMQQCLQRAVKGFGIAWSIRALVVGLPQLFRLKPKGFLQALRHKSNWAYGVAGLWLLLAHELVCGVMRLVEVDRVVKAIRHMSMSKIDAKSAASLATIVDTSDSDSEPDEQTYGALEKEFQKHLAELDTSVQDDNQLTVGNGPLDVNFRYTGAIAGAVGGLSVCFLPASAQVPTAIFLLARSTQVLAGVLANRGWCPVIPHANELCFILTSAQIMWAWIFNPDCLGKGYLRFLNRFGRTSEATLRNIQSLLTTPGKQVGMQFGRTLYPKRSFFEFHASYWLTGFRAAIKVYLPVFTVPLILFQHRRLIKDPVASFVHVVTSVVRSCVFLTTYTSAGWISADLFFRTGWLNSWFEGRGSLLREISSSFVCGGFPGCGTAIFLEKPQRRVELVLFVLMHSLQSLYNQAAAAGRIGSSPLAGTVHAALMASASCSLMTHALHQHTDMLRPQYLSMLRFLFVEQWPWPNSEK